MGLGSWYHQGKEAVRSTVAACFLSPPSRPLHCALAGFPGGSGRAVGNRSITPHCPVPKRHCNACTQCTVQSREEALPLGRGVVSAALVIAEHMPLKVKLQPLVLPKTPGSMRFKHARGGINAKPFGAGLYKH